MKIADRAVLVTGANRGLGRALVEEALRRGAQRVYAAARQPFAHSDARVTPVTLDVTNPAQIRQASGKVESLDLLINNAAVAQYDNLSDRAALERHLAVNVFGLFDVTQAFLPALTRSRGAVVNVISDSALTPVPFVPSYSMSKAAAFSLTQSMRALWAAQGVSVHAALAGPIDTDMSRDADIPKSSAEAVARGILDGVEQSAEDIFPDPVSASLAQSWRRASARSQPAWPSCGAPGRRSNARLYESAPARLDSLVHFHNHGSVKSEQVVKALGALAQESRLAVFRLLVKRGPQGYSPGELAEKLSIAAPTLSFHLKELQHAQLVSSRREGRFLYYSANFATMDGLLSFLSENCCSLADAASDAQCNSAAPAKRRRSA